MFLGLDTSAGQCAAALIGMDGAVLGRRAERMQRGHAEALFPLIEALLEEAGEGHGALRGIAVCTGPGSFTGIRVGVSAARGLALGLGVPTVGVDRFRALVLSRRPAARSAVALAGPQGMAYFRTLDEAGMPCPPVEDAGQTARDHLDRHAPDGYLRLGDAWADTVEEDGLPDPAALARDLLGGARQAGPPKPFYLRDSGAAPPREAPPVILDP